MKKSAAILLATGFEEGEAIIVIDILTRLGVNVTTLSCDSGINVDSYHGVKVLADNLLDDKINEFFDAIIIPGGPQGAKNLSENMNVINFINKHDNNNLIIAPICSAAAKVLSPHGLLKGRQYTCSGNLFEIVTDGIYVNAKVVRDGNLICGQGLGAVFDFAFNLAFLLTGEHERVMRQADHINYNLKLIQ